MGLAGGQGREAKRPALSVTESRIVGGRPRAYRFGMRLLAALLAVGLIASACTPPRDLTAATTSAPSVQPAVSAQPTPEPTTAATSSPTVAVASPEPATQVPEYPVTTSAAAFPLDPSLTLRAAAINDDAVTFVRSGIERYLDMLDHFRATGATNRNALTLTGKFGDAVFYGMKASQDVERKFAIGSLHVDRYLVKPWGTRALAEATVTILDKATSGSLPDQTETGRLRLVGDRLFVVDAWDYASGGWFNGPTLMTADELRKEVVWATTTYLGAETWLPGSPPVASGDESTPFSRARHAYLAALDRTATPSRVFESVTVQIERYETFSEIRDGLATVRITGTFATKDRAGRVSRTPFDRTLRVLFGNWIPEVVDEQVTPGVWLSGGDLALAVRDINAA